MINKVKAKFVVVFEMIDLNFINFYLSMIITRNRVKHIIQLNQKFYIKRVAQKYDLEQFKSYHIFMNDFFDSISNDEQTIDQEIKQYQNMIDSMMFAMIETKSNIINAISIVNRFVQNSNQTHIKTIKRIIVYLNITCDRCLVYDDDCN